MALGIFTRTCAKNVSGAAKIYICEQANATVITLTSGEVSTLTAIAQFMKVDADQDTIGWEQTPEKVGANNTKVTNVIDFQISTPKTATNTFLQALIDGSPCGLLAIITDGNGQNWLVGYNTTDLKSKPLRLNNAKHKTGKTISEADGGTIGIQLGNECGGLAVPFDTTLNGTINALTANFLKLA
jgi:hypothetical protein